MHAQGLECFLCSMRRPKSQIRARSSAFVFCLSTSSACHLNSMHRPSTCIHGARHVYIVCSMHRSKPLNGAQHVSSAYAPPKTFARRSARPLNSVHRSSLRVRGAQNLSYALCKSQTIARSSAFVFCLRTARKHCTALSVPSEYYASSQFVHVPFFFYQKLI
jgi:hypothetical protein